MEIHEIPRGRIYKGDELVKLLGVLVSVTHMELPSPPVEIIAGWDGEASKTFSSVRIIGGIIVTYDSGQRTKVLFETTGPSGLVKFSAGPVEISNPQTENVRSLKFL